MGSIPPKEIPPEDPNLNFEWRQFANPSYLLVDVPKEVLDSIVLNKNIPANNKLAGNIEQEYVLEDSTLVKVFCDYIARIYHDKNKHFLKKPSFRKLKFHDIWINYQKKHEYNPIHDHTGDFSFVIWLKVPFKFEDEQNHKSSIKTISKTVSCFQFNYSDYSGKLRSEVLAVDNNWEGKMLFFPSDLHHCVYPFYTSDEERISIAGNITLEV